MKEVKVKSYTRRTKSGKTITVRAHTAKRECGAGKGEGSGKEYSKKKGNSQDAITAYAKKHGYVVKRDGTFGYKGGSKRIQWTATREEIKRAMKKKSRKGSVAAAIERDFPGIK